MELLLLELTRASLFCNGRKAKKGTDSSSQYRPNKTAVNSSQQDRPASEYPNPVSQTETDIVNRLPETNETLRKEDSSLVAILTETRAKVQELEILLAKDRPKSLDITIACPVSQIISNMTTDILSTENKLLHVSLDPVAIEECPTSSDHRMVFSSQSKRENESAVTCLTFGQEDSNLAYMLLAAGYKDGSVIVYRCYRTKSEREMVSAKLLCEGEKNDEIFREDTFIVHSRLMGHKGTVTSVRFTSEDVLATSSLDKTVRYWDVDTGISKGRVDCGGPVIVTLAIRVLGFTHYYIGSCSGDLTIFGAGSPFKMPQLNVESNVTAMEFDDTGCVLFGGTHGGCIHAIQLFNQPQNMQSLQPNCWNSKMIVTLQISLVAITCIRFVLRQGDTWPILLVNSRGGSTYVVDCVYARAGGLEKLVLNQTLNVGSVIHPLISCYSPHGGGWFVTGSSDNDVHAINFGTNGQQHHVVLKEHKYPVVVVAVNTRDTILASADSFGYVRLWRRTETNPEVAGLGIEVTPESIVESSPSVSSAHRVNPFIACFSKHF